MKNKKFIVCTAAFLVLAAVVAFIGIKSSAQKPLNDGEWTGSADGRNDRIVMSVSVSGGKITAIKTVQEDETDFAKEVIAQIAEAVLGGKRVDSVDAVSGATITSNATKQAIKEALNASRGIASKKAKKALKDEKVDIVVIGAGGAGLSAATEAASKGKKVIVLEKMGNAGGNTSSATGGLNASETSVQKKLGIEDSNAQYIEDTIKGGHNLNDPDLVRNMVEHSAETVDWLIGLGADLTDVGKMAGSTNKRTHRPQGGAAIGAHLVPVLVKAAETAGAEIRYKSRVTQIVKADDGSVAGVKVLSAEGIKTNVTLIFSANQALLAARAGATYVSPFLGRIDDISMSGISLIEDIVQIFDNYGLETEIIAASIRNTVHVTECALAGADIATVPYAVIEQMTKHPLTDQGIEKFQKDYKAVFGE